MQIAFYKKSRFCIRRKVQHRPLTTCGRLFVFPVEVLDDNYSVVVFDRLIVGQRCRGTRNYSPYMLQL